MAFDLGHCGLVHEVNSSLAEVFGGKGGEGDQLVEGFLESWLPVLSVEIVEDVEEGVRAVLGFHVGEEGFIKGF